MIEILWTLVMISARVSLGRNISWIQCRTYLIYQIELTKILKECCESVWKIKYFQTSFFSKEIASNHIVIFTFLNINTSAQIDKLCRNSLPWIQYDPHFDSLSLCMLSIWFYHLIRLFSNLWSLKWRSFYLFLLIIYQSI